jgi:xanthosine phosphorylase
MIFSNYTDENVNSNVNKIRSKVPDSFTPKVGLVLGSGLGIVAEQIQQAEHFSFYDLFGFGHSSVKGHKGTLTLGYLFGMPVACLQGRPHYYEGNADDAMRTPIRTLKALGCEMVILTNAAASTNLAVPPGRLVLINDHINFFFKNPLCGPNDDQFGPRFPAMDDAYDAGLREQMQAAAKELNINLAEGVYLGVMGPAYETPAEIRAYKMLGADLVGMSTIPEVLVARHAGLKVTAISTVTNMACGLSDEKLNHDNVLIVANKASSDLMRLFKTFLEKLNVPA